MLIFSNNITNFVKSFVHSENNSPTADSPRALSSFANVLDFLKTQHFYVSNVWM